jgi:hypothetical protein
MAGFLAPFVWRKIITFLKINFKKNKFLENEFQYLIVLWKMNWKTLSCVWLCYEKETEK